MHAAPVAALSNVAVWVASGAVLTSGEDGRKRHHGASGEESFFFHGRMKRGVEPPGVAAAGAALARLVDAVATAASGADCFAIS